MSLIGTKLNILLSSKLFVWNPKLELLRHLSYKKSKYEYKKVVSNHVYKKLYPWRSKDELADTLYENIIYNEDNLIVINKPYGVGVYQPPPITSPEKSIKSTISGQGECEMYIEDTLPILQARLGNLRKLEIIKSTERFSSGIMLLTSDPSARERVRKSLRRAKAMGVPLFTFQSIVTSIPPTDDSRVEKVGIKLIDIPEMKQKAPIIEKKISKFAMKAGEVKVARIELKTIAVNNTYNVALVEISTTTTKSHFVRVYAAYKLAPILGDAMYAARVKVVLGKAIAISPFNSACYNPPLLSDKLCNRLHVPKENINHVPAHLHLHRVTLTSYFGKKDLVLTANPNDRFLWTAEQLSISPVIEVEQIEHKVG